MSILAEKLFDNEQGLLASFSTEERKQILNQVVKKLETEQSEGIKCKLKNSFNLEN